MQPLYKHMYYQAQANVAWPECLEKFWRRKQVRPICGLALLFLDIITDTTLPLHYVQCYYRHLKFDGNYLYLHKYSRLFYTFIPSAALQISTTHLPKSWGQQTTLQCQCGSTPIVFFSFCISKLRILRRCKF